MKNPVTVSLVGLLGLALVSASAVASDDDDDDHGDRRYKVTITNLTRTQVFSPPVVDITAHSDRVDYEFKDAGYAAEFASLNDATIDE